MTEPEELDEDLFADLYENDDNPPKPSQPPAAPNPVPTELTPSVSDTASAVKHEAFDSSAPIQSDIKEDVSDMRMQDEGIGEGNYGNGYVSQPVGEEDYGPIGIKEDGKMFIGGLNWETTDQSLKDYFSQFGEVLECTVMRDSATGRSRGFGFLTFKDPKTVNIVMVKEHWLDGKTIDPKRAIPREEQERTSKIFVGGVSQEATEDDFKKFFQQFGRVIDATLMMDKDTNRPRGFGFVTFDGDAAVDATLAQPLEIHGKRIEVKRAQPRGNLRDGEEDKQGKFGRGRNDKFGQNDQNAQQMQNQVQQANPNGAPNGISPSMIAQYWQRMQQYFQMMQQQLSVNLQQGQMNPMMAGGQMNPAMMQQMQQMMAMQNMQQGPDGTPLSQSPGPGQQGGMNPAMLQQMQQMQHQMQGAYPQGGASPGPAVMQQSLSGGAGGRPGFNAQEQLLFEQQKYEQQQARRMAQQAAQHQQQQNQAYSNFGQGGPTSWEGMYDDVPQPNLPPSGPSSNSGGSRGNFSGKFRGGHGGGQKNHPQVQPSNAPANAPTGPKNAGKPGANYRGGGRHGQRGFHPYSRNG
ncbi:RNA-binding domain-containing protein [Patellaria atrata CBS 101060]|uniref:RNA-binding domain-containing protein n=1 Tax=Patellaria atrata CBS 101060 TaxID=1346257 RepID=A0A9P4S2G8_9PEZI|nr:RNA-binding domain-containing protein [Patellaria atrata CBS 101060]